MAMGANVLDKDISINKSAFLCQDIQRSHSPGIFYGESPVNYSFTLLMLELILLVSITSIIRFLLKPLKQPRVVSDILGGMMVGPSMLGRNKSFSKYIFPPNATYITRNIGVIGFIYYMFLSGVKMDVTLARKAGKKQLSLAAFGFLVPFLVGLIISFSIRKFMDKDLAKPQIIGVVTCVFAISSFPVIEQIIKELNLLSSEVGRLALATTIITDVVSINCIVVFEAARHYDHHPLNTLWVVLSALAIAGFVLACKHVLIWIVNTTPEGKPVHESYVVIILLGALVMSFMSDVTAINLAVGPHWLGLVIPTGPPLGAIIVERTDTLLNEFFMPFAFAFVGMKTDVTTIFGDGDWATVWPLLAVAVAVCVAKFWTVFGVARFYELPVKDSLALSFVMGMRGQVEYLLYLHWLALLVVPIPSFSMLVVVSTLITAISTPMVSILYDPTRPYMVNKRRAVQFTAPDSELRIVACIHDQDSVGAFISLLELSNPTQTSPFAIFALRLIELVGRAHPVFVDHENQTEEFEGYDRIHNALTAFQESVGECVRCQHFTSVSPTRTMYQDVCKLAMTKKAAIIILPFRTDSLDGRTEVVHHGVLHSLNTNVLSHAPCSVGILVDRASPFRNNRRSPAAAAANFAVLFLGGADAREALTYADRMASNPDVSLSVVRFLSRNGIGDDKTEKKLDDGIVTWFWVKNEGNERVAYREAVVGDGSETVLAIQAMMSECFFDLWIVGRKSGINQVLTQGLSNWSNNDELGVIGDYIASVELAMNSSVLVVQQQILRGQEGGYSGGLLGKFSCCS